MQTPQPPESSDSKKLVRPIKGRIVAGVALGVARYLNIDPTVVRLLLAFLILFTGLFPGLALYIIAWIIMPEAN